MLSFRVTKYDPAHRSSSGSYLRETWTAISDVGRTFNGEVLSHGEYMRTEDAYVGTAIALLRAAGVERLTISGLENRDNPLAPTDGEVVTLEQLDSPLRQVLRETFWCRFQGEDGFVHVGYDYYMYVGVSRVDPDVLATATRGGLFLESFESPYESSDVA